jgi:DNA-binding LacI/PurR family transcriptional regulator
MSVKVTIATVARHANVSRQTVSNVLNTPDLVRDETRARVQAAIESLGYRANLAARQMRTGRSRLIGVRIDPVRNGIEGSVLDRFLHGLTEAAAPAGYRVVLYTATDDPAEIASYEELLASYALDGFVLTHTHHGDSRTAWLAEHDIPFVTFGRPWGATDSHSWVDVDGAAGAAAATSHLIAAGHTRIGFLGWPEGSGVGDDRHAGWVRALEEAGFVTTNLDRRVVDGNASGEQAARSLIKTRRPPTAVVCASDALAMGARAAGDLVVIGFDDTPAAAAIGLSSVRQPLAEAAARCVRLLARLLDQGPAPDPPNHVLLQPHLVVRQSG